MLDGKVLCRIPGRARATLCLVALAGGAGCVSTVKNGPGQYHLSSSSASREALTRKARRICPDYKFVDGGSNSTTSSGGTMTYDKTNYSSWRTATHEYTTTTTTPVTVPVHLRTTTTTRWLDIVCPSEAPAATDVEPTSLGYLNAILATSVIGVWEGPNGRIELRADFTTSHGGTWSLGGATVIVVSADRHNVRTLKAWTTRQGSTRSKDLILRDEVTHQQWKFVSAVASTTPTTPTRAAIPASLVRVNPDDLVGTWEWTSDLLTVTLVFGADRSIRAHNVKTDGTLLNEEASGTWTFDAEGRLETSYTTPTRTIDSKQVRAFDGTSITVFNGYVEQRFVKR